MNKLLIIVPVFFLLIASSANAYCSENSYQCNPYNGNVLQKCVSSSWVDWQSCQYGCNAGTNSCASQSSCTTGNFQCKPSYTNILQKCVNSAWVDWQFCTYGCNAGSNSCYQASGCYIEGSYQCNPNDANVLQKCVNSIWTNYQSCAYGCNSLLSSCNSLTPPTTTTTTPTINENCYPAQVSCVLCLTCQHYECKAVTFASFGNLGNIAQGFTVCSPYSNDCLQSYTACDLIPPATTTTTGVGSTTTTTISPTTTTTLPPASGSGSVDLGNPNADTWINQASPTNVDGTADYIEIVTYQEGVNSDDALINFSISSIPSNGTVTNAILYLYAIQVSNMNWTGINASEILIDWNISAADWNNMHDQFNVSTTVYNITPLVENEWTSFNVTNIVLDWVNTGINNGIYLRGDALGDGTVREFHFASSRHATATLRPKLIVNYTYNVPYNTCFSEGSYQCDPLNANVLQKCQSGTWQGWSSCTYGCNATIGSCSMPPTNSTPTYCYGEGNYQCDPTSNVTLQRCVNNTWIGWASCAYGCNLLTSNCNPYTSTRTCAQQNGVVCPAGDCAGYDIPASDISTITQSCCLRPCSTSQPVFGASAIFNSFGIGFVGNFFTPFFLSTALLLVISALISYYASGKNGMNTNAFGMTAVILVIIYSVIGIYPVWIGVVMVLMSVAFMMYVGRKLISGG